jgi:hypothetical protein
LGAAVAVAAATALLALWIDERRRGVRSRRRADAGRALRRGVEAGVVVAAIGLLRSVDGLTPITGGFVLAGFGLAELVLGSRRAARSG